MFVSYIAYQLERIKKLDLCVQHTVEGTSGIMGSILPLDLDDLGLSLSSAT